MNVKDEQIKLLANTTNAIGLAIFAFGGIRPMISGEFTLASLILGVISFMILVLLHLSARSFLALSEDENE